MRVHKVVLSTKKEVILREPKISDQELATQAASNRVGDNPLMVGMAASKEMIKMLIQQIDGKAVKPIELENLDDVFSFGEYAQLQKAVVEITGADAAGKFQLVTGSSGAT